MKLENIMKEVEFTIECMPEDHGPEGEFDLQEDVDQIRADMEWNEWAWCIVKVTASIPGLDIEGTDYLGGCSYKNKADFETGGYYEDMKAQALADLCEEYKRMRSTIEKLEK